MTISLNQKIISPNKGIIPIEHPGFLRGKSVYETIRTFKQKPFRLEEHLDRLMESAEMIHLKKTWNQNQIKLEVFKLIEFSNSEAEKRVRVILTDQDLIVMLMDLEEKPNKLYEAGVKLITFRGVRPFPRAKTLSDITCHLANEQAKREDCYDAILMNPFTESFTECAYANLFWIKEKKLFTTSENILPGITRQVVIELAKKCEFRICRTEDLVGADEVFITQTTSGILPVRKIENKEYDIKNNEVTRELMEQYRQVINH